MDRRPIRGADGPAGTLAAWTRPARAPGIDQAAAWDRRLAARRSRLRFSSPRVSRPHEAPESANLPRPAALDAGLQARAHGRLRPSGPRTARRVAMAKARSKKTIPGSTRRRYRLRQSLPLHNAKTERCSSAIARRRAGRRGDQPVRDCGSVSCRPRRLHSRPS